MGIFGTWIWVVLKMWVIITARVWEEEEVMSKDPEAGLREVEGCVLGRNRESEEHKR